MDEAKPGRSEGGGGVIWFGGVIPQVRAFPEGTLLHHLGFEVAHIGDDFLQIRMPVDHRTRQPFGRLHGGASVALAETAGSMGAGLCVDPETSIVVGLEINANHVRPAYEGWVTATARPEIDGPDDARLVDPDRGRGGQARLHRAPHGDGAAERARVGRRSL